MRFPESSLRVSLMARADALLSAQRVGTRLSVALSVVVLTVLAPARTLAAGPPAIPSTWVTGVTSTSAVMRAEVNPEGLATSYHFQYIADAAFEANLETGREGFFGARSVPTSNNGLG